MLEIYWETIFSRRLKLERRIKKTLSKLTGLKKLMSWQMVMINEIKVYDSFSKLITSTHFKLLGNQSVFNQKEFNRSLNNNLLLLRSITIQGEKLVLKGHKLLIIATYINLQNKYQQLVREIKNFSPRGVSKEFTIGFKASMKKLSSRLELKSNSHKINALSIIENNEILSYQNFNFIKDKDFIKEIDYRYLASKLVSTADTEGKLR